MNTDDEIVLRAFTPFYINRVFNMINAGITGAAILTYAKEYDDGHYLNQFSISATHRELKDSAGMEYDEFKQGLERLKYKRAIEILIDENGISTHFRVNWKNVWEMIESNPF